MLKKRLLTLSMAFVMVASISFGTIESDITYAKTNKASSESTNDDTKDNLEKVIKIVKKRITIPAECTEFDYYVDSYSDSSVRYSLTWRDINYQNYFNVVADEKGNIINYQTYDYSDLTKVSYLKSELEKDAQKAIEKLNPVMKGHIKFASSSYSKYSNSYEFKYNRVENDIPMDNYVSVLINADTKELTGFNTNWLFDVKIPSADTKISKEEAKKLVKKQLKMELKYLSKYEYKDNEYKKSVFLAYVPNMSYISVDAKTGEIYTTQSEWNQINTTTGADMKSESPAAAKEDRLTEQEISALNALDELISKEEAVKLITENKNIYLESTAISISANLSKYDDEYYWNISFADPREVDYSTDDTYRAYAYATIDAKSGIIKSYYASINENKQPYTLKPIDGCQRKFETFVKSQDKEMMANAKFYESEEIVDPIVILAREESRATTFNYYRVNEGVVYEDNYINGGVDRGTGKVYMYNYYWDKDIKFESPKDVISAEKALDYYLSLPGFEIKYEENQINTYDQGYETLGEYYYNDKAYNVEKEVRLVYNNTSIYSGLISPFTGKEMDYEGNAVEVKETAFDSYTDIKGHQYERSILLLSDIGLGYEKDKFRPDELITKEDFIKFFEVINMYYSNDNQDFLPDYRVTRQQAAQFIIDRCGLTEIAKLEGIYKLDYTDAGTITKDAFGAVALCKGLDLLQFGKDNSFGPSEKLTRGEAAKLVMDLMTLPSKY